MDTATNSTTEETTDILAVSAGAKLSPALLFVPSGLNDVIAKIRATVDAHVPDISTDKGRKAIASLARKVSSSKTYLDDLGKSLTADLKAQCGIVDAERKRAREELDELRDKVRKPLTDWEDKEKARIALHEQLLSQMADLAVLAPAATSDVIEQRRESLIIYAERDWQEFQARYEAALKHVAEMLASALAQARERETEREELERLRAAEEVRKTAEREESIRVEAARVAEARAATAEREAERLAEQAVRDKADAEIREIARASEAQAAVERAERQAAIDAEQAVQHERERVAEQERIEAAELAKREANTRHKGRINREIVDALVLLGLDEVGAKKIVTAMAKGEIPHVQVNY